MEFLHVAIHAVRKIRYIGRLDKDRRAASVVGLFSSRLSRRLHTLHPVGHIHLLGRENSCGCKHACARQNILQKPAPITHCFSFQRSFLDAKRK